MFLETETARINRIIESGSQKGLTDRQFFAAELKEWKTSRRRHDQIIGDRYYCGRHDILRRKRTTIGENGELQEVVNLPNNRIMDNQYAKMVDQKVNYLLGKPLTINSENKKYADTLKKLLGKRFQRTLKYIGEDSLNGGLSWLYPYYDSNGEIAFKHFPAHEILPFWADDDHTVLDAVCRLYLQEVWDGQHKVIVEKVEIFQNDGLYRYVFDGDTLIPDVVAGEHENYFKVVDSDGETEWNWTRIPLIPFKFNKQEIPLIKKVKSLQDGINLMLSDFENNMQEDARNTILVIENYDGANLGEFRKNLATYGAVKVRTGDGAKGGVSTLTITVNAENYKVILELFKKALIENAMGYDAKDDRLAGNPNQMNIQSMYSDIDLDANSMETEYQAAMEDLLWFVDQHLKNTGQGDFLSDEVTIIFDRDMMINEGDIIENCGKSAGIISDETIVENHPWVTDVEAELKRMKDQKAEAMQDPFGDGIIPQQTGAAAGGEGV